MTQEEFIKVLDGKEYHYELEGDKIIVTEGGSVYLNSLTSLPSGVVFKNGGVVDLNSLTSLPPDVEFRNGGDVYFKSLIGGWFYYWEGDIEGIDRKRLLNHMISKGMFI